MTRLTARAGSAQERSNLSRREFLQAGALGTLGLLLTKVEASHSDLGDSGPAVIMLMMVGGPSQLETFDPKPDAPAEVRGPFRSIATAVPGVRVVEHLPRLARRMKALTLIRTLHHDLPPIHEFGRELVRTIRSEGRDEILPDVGSIAERRDDPVDGVPPFIVLPGPIGADSEDRTVSPGARSAFDVSREPDRLRDAYGRTGFGRNCLLARRLVEAGARVVVVNMYETVFEGVSWDCHGSRPFSTLDDYASEVLPTFDVGFSALLDDLDRRGRLVSTLVVATGEFGRTPRVNAAGGRDHWSGVWSAAMAGGGLAGGRVIGASDARAAEPIERPVTPAELVATIDHALRIDPSRALDLPGSAPLAFQAGVGPIAEALS